MLSKNKFKEKIERGEKVRGAFFNLGSPAAAEILGLLGLDYIVIDCEHGPQDVESTEHLIRACELRGLPPIVRVREADRTSILKMLDIGAMGLLVPFIKTPEEVHQLVVWSKYRPLGDRGFGLGRKQGYGLEEGVLSDIQGFFQWSNSETLLIPQCETVECLEKIEEIAAIDGVDAIFVGPFDLSISLGIPQDFTNPVFIHALQKTVAACKSAGKFAFTVGSTPQDAKAMYDLGFDGVMSADTSFLMAGAMQYMQGIKQLGY